MFAAYVLLAPLWIATPVQPAVHSVSPPAHVVMVSGVGRAPARVAGPQAKLMARRAAEVVAVRNLAKELHLSSPATLSGFRYGSAAHHADGSVTVTVEWRNAR